MGKIVMYYNKEKLTEGLPWFLKTDDGIAHRASHVTITVPCETEEHLDDPGPTKARLTMNGVLQWTGTNACVMPETHGA